MKRQAALAVALVLALGGLAVAATIQPGETREIAGELKAVSAQTRTVVLDAPTEKGVLTIGATAPDGAVITRMGKPVKLDALAPGKKAKMVYKREGDALMVVSIDLAE